MKVKELIEELRKYDENAIVQLIGDGNCCFGTIERIELVTADKNCINTDSVDLIAES